MKVELSIEVSDKLQQPSAFVGIALESAMRAWDSEPGGIARLSMDITTPGGDRHVGTVSLRRVA